MNRPLSIVIKPRTLALVATGPPSGDVHGISGKRSDWLDMAHTNIKHFGLKGIFEHLNASVATAISTPLRIETTYYMAFKGSR